MAKRGRKPAIALSRRRATVARPRTAERSPALQPLVRATRLLNCLAEYPDGASLSTAAEATALPLATAHRILTTLQQERYTRFDAERRAWFVGAQAFVSGNAFARQRGLVEIARPRMTALMQETGETVSLATEDNCEAVYLSQVECRQVVRVIARAGSRVPLHCSAVGKVLLSAMPEERALRILTERGLPALTSKTKTDIDALWRELEECRRRGYALDAEEHSCGLSCLAAAIYNEHGEAIGAIAVSGPAPRFPASRITALGECVRAAAQAITEAYGGRAPAAII